MSVRTGLIRLAEAFDALTYKEMMECADVMVHAIKEVNGMSIKDTAMAQALATFGEFLEGEMDDD